MNKGIIVAGHMCVDVLKKIDAYPDACNLTTIRRVDQSMGGLVPNCIQDLAIIDPTLPLTAVGIVGDDSYGAYIRQNLAKYPNISTEHVKVKGQTSFTDVMYDSVKRTRAFFQFRGANAEFGPEDCDFDQIQGDILHAGYILLMDTLDEADETYGTKMARLLANAQAHGIRTSIDIVSEESDRYKKVVIPALRYTDYCVINEIESAKITDIPSKDADGNMIEENMPKILKALRSLGVSNWIIIHARDASYGLDTDGTYVRIDALDIPRSMIAGTTGAGDAFCSGVLYAAYKGMSMIEAMNFGTAVASCSILTAGASDGIRSYEETLRFSREFPEPKMTVVKP